jgi:TolB protein
LVACGGRPRPVVEAKPDDRVAIVAAESASSGIKLVAIDERGDRQFDLLAPSPAIAKDMSPAVSPDGTMIAFASTRDRPLHEPSIWIAKLGVEVAPRRLTIGGIDANPVWTRDGKAIVFASTRGGGDDFDLWQVAVAGGEPVQLTSGDEHEVSPSIAPDGAIIYASVDRVVTSSHIEQRAPDGTITKLTPGPDEREPAVSPDGKLIAFVSRVERNGRRDAELWWMARGATDAKQLVDLPPTDETGPVWSRDGRHVFATSTLAGANEQALFASIIFIDRHEQPPRVRMLRDSAGGQLIRLTPGIATALDATALKSDPEYLPELAKIMAEAIAKQKEQQ